LSREHLSKIEKIIGGSLVEGENKAKPVLAPNASKMCGNQCDAVELQIPAKSLTGNDLC
jgi:hypothetical protein